MKKTDYGFTLVEMLMILALGLTFFVGIISLYRISLISGTKATNALQAKELAKEGIEAVIAVRDSAGNNWDWTNTPSNTASNEYYQPTISGNAWILGSKTTTIPYPTLPSPHNGFSRIVKIDQVQRGLGCGQSVCPIVISGGSVDSGTRKITVSVSWSEEKTTKYATISSYLTHWR